MKRTIGAVLLACLCLILPSRDTLADETIFSFSKEFTIDGEAVTVQSTTTTTNEDIFKVANDAMRAAAIIAEIAVALDAANRYSAGMRCYDVHSLVELDCTSLVASPTKVPVLAQTEK